MLREMAEHRGCKLVKSRRRTPGAGDYGRYGLKDAATGREVMGFGADGLSATADEIEAYLRKGLIADWKRSLSAAPEAPPLPPMRKARRTEPEGPRGRRPRPERAASPPPPPPAPKPQLKIREAAPRDAEAIAALLGELGFPNDGTDVRKRLAALTKAGEPPLVADEDGPIGCLTWHVTPVLHRPTAVGRVTMLAVTKKARGRGVGTALLQAAEERLRKAGCALVEVTSNIELGGAHEFYKDRGYRRTSYRFVKNL
jgi:ribosomal protein S18 acetylase RimI-like enzyme